MSAGDHRTRSLLVCLLAFALGAVAGWGFVEVVWHQLTRGVYAGWGWRPNHQEYFAFSLISTLSGAMIGLGLALPADKDMVLNDFLDSLLLHSLA